jgi:hypothetical protein
MHSQRCKLHLAYLTSGPNDNPTYTSSRAACLKSARDVIRAETQLLASNHAFVQIRLRVAAILYGVFIASIVLLMDACLHRPEAVQDEVQHGDLGAALRIIGDMTTHSMAAATLHESLMQIVARYRAQRQEGHDGVLARGTQGRGQGSTLRTCWMSCGMGIVTLRNWIVWTANRGRSWMIRITWTNSSGTICSLGLLRRPFSR